MTRIEQEIEIAVPVHAAYNQWTQFEQFPRFMQGVQEVRQIDDAHLHWVADCDGQRMEWDSELVDQVPDQMLSWRSTSGALNTGTVRFTPVGDDRTLVKLEMESESPRDGGGTPPDEQMLSERVREDMQRFKTLLETQGTETGAWRGEIHQGQVVSNGHAQQASSAGTGQAQGQEQVAGAGMPQVQPRNAQPSRPLATGSQTWLPQLASMWEEPLAMMRRMSEEMDRMVERFIGRPSAFAAASGLSQWTPAIEVSQQGDEMIISADLPGMSRDDVKVEVRGDNLVIEGQRQETHQSNDPFARRSERRFGRFYRMIALPQGADADAAQAVMQNGVLQVRMPVANLQARGRSIAVQQAQPQLQSQSQSQPSASPAQDATSVGEETGKSGSAQPGIQQDQQPRSAPLH